MHNIRSFHVTNQNREFLFKKIENLDPTKQWICNITEKKSKRSSDQNSRYWKLLTDFGRYLGYESEEMHEICRYKYLREYVVVGDERMEKLKSTTKLNTQEFTEYMDAIDRWAVSLGFVWEGEI
jgi:hypothetical protein